MSGIINFLTYNTKPSKIESVFDGLYTNSVSYGAPIVSSASEFRFNYSGTYLGLKGITTIYGNYPQFSKLSIIINDIVWQVVTISNNTYLHEFELPEGFKSIVIVTSALSKPSSIIGCYIGDVVLDSSKFQKINSVPTNEKLVFLGDSITVGANAINPSIQGYAQCFRYLSQKQVAVLGYGYGAYKDFGETQTKINGILAHLSTLFFGVTTKKLVVSLGTNDVGVYGLTGTTVKPWITALVSQVKAAHPTVAIYLISPIIRGNDNATYDGIRTVLGEVATEQLCTHIYGKNILTTSDLSDGVHPTTEGHLKYYETIKSMII